MTPEEEARQRLETEEDYVPLKRFDYSLKVLLDRYPDGVPDRIAAQALLVEEDDLPEIYERILSKLRKSMGVTSAAS